MRWQGRFRSALAVRRARSGRSEPADGGVSGTVLGVLNASGEGHVGFGALPGEDGGHVGQQDGQGVVSQLCHA